MKTITQETRPILEELELELRKIYKGRFKNLILYGSHARGKATEDFENRNSPLLLNVRKEGVPL